SAPWPPGRRRSGEATGRHRQGRGRGRGEAPGTPAPLGQGGSSLPSRPRGSDLSEGAEVHLGVDGRGGQVPVPELPQIVDTRAHRGGADADGGGEVPERLVRAA